MNPIIGFSIASMILAAIAVGYYALATRTMREERDWAIISLAKAQARLDQYRNAERTHRANLREWGRRGAEKTNGGRK